MADSTKLTRQEIYQRIRETSKDEYILSEMKRLGFWPKSDDKPELSEAIIVERSEINRRLRELGKEQRLYQDPQAALKKLHEERKKEAKLKREKTRQKRNQERFERAKRWHDTQSKLVTYIGEGVSCGLNDVSSDAEKLAKQSLPVIHDSQGLAQAMGVTISELRFLAYQKNAGKISHYQRFEITKKTGGTRLISAPMPRLKRSQYWILSNILEKLPLHSAAHGFIAGKSILSNARPHVSRGVVINMDLKNFFPSVKYSRVKGVFKNFGYSEHLATIFSLLCTELDTTEVVLDGESWHVGNSDRFLPQGAPTSPYISNLICRKMDARLHGVAQKHGFVYTRYADDLTFSAESDENNNLTKLLWAVRRIVRDEGFVVHPKKTRIMHKHRRQEVTGVVVNNKTNADRKTLKRFRALLYQIDKNGPEGKSWGNGSLFPSIEGYANFVAMVNPTKGIALQKQVVDLKRKYGFQVKPWKISQLNKKLFKAKAAQGIAPRDPWWQAQMPALPEVEKTAAQIKASIDEGRASDLDTRQAPEDGSATTPQQHESANFASAGKWMFIMGGLVVLLILLLSK